MTPLPLPHPPGGSDPSNAADTGDYTDATGATEVTGQDTGSMQGDGLQGDDEIMSPNHKGPSSWANSGRGQQARQQARGSSKPGNAGGPLAKSRLLAAARAEHEAGGSPQSNPSGFFATFFRRGAPLLPGGASG